MVMCVKAIFLLGSRRRAVNHFLKYSEVAQLLVISKQSVLFTD